MEILIRENDVLPIYEQIMRELKKAIVKKELLPGDMLPSIRSLARRFGNQRYYDEAGV